MSMRSAENGIPLIIAICKSAHPGHCAPFNPAHRERLDGAEHLEPAEAQARAATTEVLKAGPGAAFYVAHAAGACGAIRGVPETKQPSNS